MKKVVLNYAIKDEVTYLPDDISYDFKELFKLAPEEYGKVQIFNKQTGEYGDKTIFRKYMSYLHTPKFDSTTNKSYMFTDNAKELPKDLQPFVDFVQGSIDTRYNQLSVNWYERDDYIEPHRDCTKGMLSKDSPVLIVSLNEPHTCSRSMKFVHVETGEVRYEPLISDKIFTIRDHFSWRHSVGPGEGRRISLTFRQMSEAANPTCNQPTNQGVKDVYNNFKFP